MSYDTLPVVFNPATGEGDFRKMIEDPTNSTVIFLYAGNLQQDAPGTTDCTPGGGTAAVRRYRKTQSHGIVTGSRGNGFHTLTPEAKDVIEACFEELKEKLKKFPHFDTIAYSADPKDGKSWGNGIFTVGEDVKAFILKKITELSGGEKEEEPHYTAPWAAQVRAALPNWRDKTWGEVADALCKDDAREGRKGVNRQDALASLFCSLNVVRLLKDLGVKPNDVIMPYIDHLKKAAEDMEKMGMSTSNVILAFWAKVPVERTGWADERALMLSGKWLAIDAEEKAAAALFV